MTPTAIIMLILGILGVASGIGTSIFGNNTNEELTRENNATNLQISRETNAANVQQAEIAYQRSLPVNQVCALMNAGLSRAGALQHISGGGSYTPPVLTSAVSQAPQKDMSGISSAMDRLFNIPSNVMQANMQEEQRKLLQQTYESNIAEERRKQEQHDFDMWQKLYGKNTALILDNVSSKVSDALLQSGKEINEFKSFDDMLRSLNLANDKDIKNIPHLARTQLEQSIRDKFAESRAQQHQSNENRAAYDAHDLAEYQKAIAEINVKYYSKEKHEQLLNLMRVGQGLIEDNNIKFQDRSAKEMENYVREAGIDSEADARALAEYVRKLQNDDKLDVASHAANYPQGMKTFRAGLRLFLSDLGEILSKVRLGE